MNQLPMNNSVRHSIHESAFTNLPVPSAALRRGSGRADCTAEISFLQGAQLAIVYTRKSQVCDINQKTDHRRGSPGKPRLFPWRAGRWGAQPRSQATEEQVREGGPSPPQWATSTPWPPSTHLSQKSHSLSLLAASDTPTWYKRFKTPKTGSLSGF